MYLLSCMVEQDLSVLGGLRRNLLPTQVHWHERHYYYYYLFVTSLFSHSVSSKVTTHMYRLRGSLTSINAGLFGQVFR
jgi:hypothetical protein